MTDRLLLDTHIALWLDSGEDALRSSTRAQINGCWQNGGTIYMSAVTIWEIALLVDTLELDLPIEGWIARFVERPALKPYRSHTVPRAALIACISSSIAILLTGS